MTIATRITIARFFFVPPVVVAVCGPVWWPGAAARVRIAAIAVFALAAATDFLDGFLARRLGQETRLGAALDPLADKLLLGAAIWAIWACRGAYGPVPVWYPVIVTLNDVVLGGGFLLVRHRIDPDRLRAMVWGKAASALQIVVVVWLLVRAPQALVPIVVAAALTAASGTAYVVRALRLMNRTALRARDSQA
jgi:CDP-diacylglycerol--glycerol-3-phosphate 3-phosphatidyltransferase